MESEKFASQKNKLSVDAELWDELAARQQNNGSWEGDLETTVIASNALAQSVDLMDENEEEIEWDTDGDSLEDVKEKNSESVEAAQEWTVINYEDDAPISTQVYLSYHIGFINRQNEIDKGNITNLTQQINNVILKGQLEDGSWSNNIQQTSFSLYVLKKDQDVSDNAINAGENWLISQQKNGSWGSVLNDTFALLALHNTSYDMTNVINYVVSNQMSNGSIGDLETTAWAVIALSLYDTPNSREAANSARQWLLEQKNVSDRDLALISLAESEYITREVNRIQSTHGIQHGKSPPLIIVFFTGILGGIIIILSILYIRLGEHDALDGIRKDIYEFVKVHPGVNQNALMRRLNISSSSIRHHLRILEQYDYILPHNDGKYIRYYINKNGYSLYTNGNGYKEIISVLRKSTASNIVKFILENPNTTQSHLAEALNLHPSTIHWHTKLLLSTKIISVKRSGKSVQYEINEPMDINKLLALAN